MKKYLHLLKTDFKNITKDKMIFMMLVYPLMIMLIFGLILPLIIETATDDTDNIEFVMNIITVFAVGLGSFIYGFMFGMLLLEDVDSKVINGICTSPIGAKGYIIYKSILVYVLSVIGTIVILVSLPAINSTYYENIGRIETLQLIVFSISSSLFAPISGMLIALISKNKVAGFMSGKTMALALFVPVLLMLESFQGALQYALGIFPNFWSIKALLNDILYAGGVSLLDNAANLPNFMYHIIGIAYSIVLTIVLGKLLIKKCQEV